MDGLQQLLVDEPEHETEGYHDPMLAFQLSIKTMGVKEKQLLAVLRHFPPVKEVAIAVVQAVWRGFSYTSAELISRGH